MRIRTAIISLITALLALQYTAGAQSLVDSFAAKAAASRVSFNYELKVLGEVNINGNGSVRFEGDGYKLDGNGVSIISNGVTRWTVDEVSKEAYIEAVGNDGGYLIANPVALLRNIGSAFTQGRVTERMASGKKLTSVEMTPAASGSGLRKMTVRFSGDVLSSAEITNDDGVVTVINISNLLFSEPSGEDFTLDTAGLGADWVVTDLR